MFLSYTPLRNIVGGLGEINHNLSKFLYSPKEDAVISKSMSGAVEGTLKSIEDIFNVVTQPIPRGQIEKWREWYASTAAAETFVIDEVDEATKTAPVSPKTFYRVVNTYKEKQEGIYFVVSFKIVRVY